MRHSKINLEKEPALPSEKSFGAFFAVISLGFFVYFYHLSNLFLSILFLGVSIYFLAATIFQPTLLAPLNRLWYEFGNGLSLLVSPIVLGLFFFIMITPVGILSRFGGRDTLRLRRPRATTYWVERNPSGPASQSFKNQF